MAKAKKKEKLEIPEPTIRRLPWYLSHIKLLHAQGIRQVSSTTIAQGVGLDNSLVAKDLSYINLQGRTKIGYQTDELIDTLERYLGFTDSHRAYLFGVGSLGAALLADRGLRQFGLDIVAGFDVDPKLIGTYVGEIPIYDMKEFTERMEGDNVQIAVLTVPIKQAQSVSDLLVGSGFRAIWNFTPVRIQTSEEVVVQNTSLYSHLALMYMRFRVHQNQEA